MNAETLREYLVSVGFKVDDASLLTLNSTLDGIESKIGSLFCEGSGLNNVKKEADNAKKALDDASTGANDASATLGSDEIEKGFTRGATSISLIKTAAKEAMQAIQECISVYMGYETAQTDLQIALGVKGTTAEIERMTQAAKDASSGTIFSYTDVLGSYTQLVKGGLSTEQAVDYGDIVLKAATMMELPIEKAASHLISAVMTKNISTPEDATAYFSQAITTANEAIIDVDELLASADKLGNLSDIIGGNYKDLFTMLALGSQSGISMSTVTSSLRTSMANWYSTYDVTDPPYPRLPSNVALAFEKLDVEMEDGQGNLRDFFDVVFEVTQKLEAYRNEDGRLNADGTDILSKLSARVNGLPVLSTLLSDPNALSIPPLEFRLSGDEMETGAGGYEERVGWVKRRRFRPAGVCPTVR